MPTENASAAALLCAVCGEGFFRSGPHRCESCDSLVGMSGYMFAAGLLAVLCCWALATSMCGKSYRSLGSGRESNPLNGNDAMATQVRVTRDITLGGVCRAWQNTSSSS